MNNNVKLVISFILLVILLVPATYFYKSVKLSRAVENASKALEEKYPNVAYQYLKKYKGQITHSKDHCKLLLDSIIGVGHPHKIMWAAEACHYAGHKDLKEVYLGYSIGFELKGNLQAAINVLANNIKTFEKIPDFYYRLAKLFMARKENQAAANMYLQTIERAPKNMVLHLESLNFLSSNKYWAAAARVAEKMITGKVENSEAKLIMARALINGRKPDLAKKLVSEVKSSMGKMKDNIKSVLLSRYKDLLVTGTKSKKTKSKK